MFVYFRLGCFAPETTKNIIVAINVILICLAAVHFGYCGVIGAFLSKHDNNSYTQSFRDEVRAFLVPPIAYISVSGFMELLSSLGIIILAYSSCCKDNRPIWRRIFLTLFILSFAFNFAIAIQTSMSTTFYNQIWKSQLQMPAYYYLMMSSEQAAFWRDYIQKLNEFVRYTKAEAVITFVLGLPLMAITIISLLDHYLKEQTDNDTSITTPQIKDSVVELQQQKEAPI